MTKKANPKRYSEKRPSEIKVMNLDEPFDQKLFNFTKINQDEVLLSLVKEDKPLDHKNIVIINNSPIDGNLYSLSSFQTSQFENLFIKK